MLRTYLRWCEEQGIKIDPRLSVRVPSDGQSLSTSNAPGTDETQRDARSVLAAETGNVPDMDETEQGAHGLCVFATAFIENREIVASIPKSAVLSARNFRYSRGLEEFLCEREVDPNLSLSLALCIERQLGQASKWWGYIQSLPKDPVDLVAFWPSDASNDDTKEALQWLRGTGLLRYMACEVRPSLSDILSFFNTVFLPFSGSIGVQPVTFDDFCYAFSMVSSRAFRVDNYHTLALVPIADAFNHAEENTVHLETDYFVCAICGSFDECPHDRDEPKARATTGSTVSTTEEDCCEMVTNAVLYGGEEVFNIYDQRLSNVKLMSHYGFLLDGNSYDEILFTVQEIEDYLAHTPSQRTRLSMQLLNELWQDLFESQELWVECLPTSSPFFPPFIEETEDDMDRESLGKRLDNERLSATFFAINASAQISPALWLYLLLRRAPQAVLDSIAPPVVQARNESLLGYLRDLAKRMSLLDVEDEECEIHGLRLGSCQALIDIAVDILTICRARLASMHWSDRPISEIAELEGALQRSRYRRRTEIAVRFALNERLILDSCIKMWENIESQLANFGADHSV